MEEKTAAAHHAVLRRLTLVAVLALTLSLVLISQAGAQGPIIYPDASGVHFFPKPPGEAPNIQEAPPFGGVNITVNSPPGGSQNETTIAVNPYNPGNLIAGANDYRGSDTACGAYFSTDGGATWTDNTPLPYESGFAASGDPGVAFDSAGHGYYLCMNFNRNANDATQYVYKSFDAGDTWGPGILAAGSPAANFDDKGHIAVDARPGSPYNGNVYIAFARLNTGELKFNRSTDGGNSFSGCPGACADFAVNDVNGGSGANLAVGAAGSVYLGWNRNYNDGMNDRAQIRVDKSIDGGVSFNALGGDVVIRDFIRDSTGSGRPAVRPIARVNFFPSFGADPTDDDLVYAVWMDDVPGNDDSDIYFSRSTDGGATWSAPKRINDDINPVGDFHSQFFPWLAVDPVDGEIDIVWYDDRNDPDRTDGTPLVDLYFASSSDHGLSFSSNLRVSTQSSDLTTDFGGAFFGDYNAIASYGGVAHPFWCDSSSGEQQVLTTAVGGADLSITKSDSPDPVFAGQSLRYDIEVTNSGPAAAFNVTVVDTLPAEVEYETDTAGCSVVGQVLTCDLGDLALGASTSFSIQVRVLPGATASGPISIVNTAVVSSDQEDPDTGDNTATASTVVNAEADLRVSKDCKPDQPLSAGETGTCFITVENLGPSMAEDVSLEDVHVSNGTFEFGTITPGGACTTTPNPQDQSGAVTCDLGDMNPGDVIEIEVPITADSPQDVNDTATARSATHDPVQANNAASDGLSFTGAANLALTKTATPNPVVAGTQLMYDLAVTNNGPSGAINVVIEDVLPAAVSIVSVTASNGSCNAGIPGNAAVPTTCTFDTLAAGASETMQIVVNVDPAFLGSLGNNAEVRSDTYDPDNSDNLATTATTVEGSADLVIDKIASPEPVLAANVLTYDVVIRNLGPSQAVDVALSDVLPAETDFQSYQISNGSGTCSLSPTAPFTLSCDLNDLLPGQFVRVVYQVLVDPATPDGTIIHNNAVASAATADPAPGNNTASVDTTVNTEADLSITKDASLDTDNPAPRIIYTVNVVNNGPSDALNVMMVDELPLTAKKVVYVFDTGNGACSYDESTHDVTCTIGTLTAGASWSVDIIVDARGSVREISNYAHVTTTTTDPNSDNNTARKDVRIKGGPGKNG